MLRYRNSEREHRAESSVRYLRPAIVISAVLCVIVSYACSGGSSSEPSGTATATATATAPPPNAEEAKGVFQTFIDTVNTGSVQTAWSLYAASIPGSTSDHLADQGCDFNAFGAEFPAMRHLFMRLAPFGVLQTFDEAAGSTTIELRVKS